MDERGDTKRYESLSEPECNFACLNACMLPVFVGICILSASQHRANKNEKCANPRCGEGSLRLDVSKKILCYVNGGVGGA